MKTAKILLEIAINKPILASVFAFVFLSVFATSQLAIAQSFDEDFNIWPTDLKINGRIWIDGNSEFSDTTSEMVGEIAKETKQPPLVLNFLAANSGEDSQSHEIFHDLETTQIDFGRRASELEKSVEECKAKIAQAATIVIFAQSSISIEQSKALSRLKSELSEAIAAGRTLVVNKTCARQLGASRFQRFDDLIAVAAGLNLIPDTTIIEDYEDASDRKQLLTQIAQNPRLVGIGIPADAILAFRGRKFLALNEPSTFLLMANEDKPLRVRQLQPGSRTNRNPYKTVVDLTAWRRDAIERTLPVFPPADPPTPHVENGTLMIVGGGGMPKGLMDQMVELAGGESAHMVFVPCLESETAPESDRMIKTWKRMGVASATIFHTKDRIQANTDEKFLEPLTKATGIWFGGGRQWNFSDSYYGTNAHRLMKEVLNRGGVIGGSSAGASIQGRYMCRANPVANFDIMAPGYERGLGFIGGVAIDQHFSQRGRQKDMTQLVDTYPQLLGIGLDEGTAIIVQKSLAKVVGKGKVFFYDRNQTVVPGEPDYVTLEAGQMFDLAEREIVESPGSTELHSVYQSSE